MFESSLPEPRAAWAARWCAPSARPRAASLAGALEAKGHPDLGQDAGSLAGLKPLGVMLVDDALPLLAKADAIVDFTMPKVSVELAGLAAEARIVHVIGTTGCFAGRRSQNPRPRARIR